MRAVATQTRKTPALKWTLLTLGFLVICGTVMVAQAWAEEPVKLQRDISATQFLSRHDGHTGFRAPEFSRAHVSAAVASQLAQKRGADKVLPGSYDTRTLGYVSPVKNQGACGACYAFGTAADLESRLLVDGRGPYDLSENNIKECNYQDASCDGGNQFMTISYLSREGVVLESCDPYVTSNTGCTSGCTSQFMVTEWLELAGSTLPDTDVLKQYIMDHGPVHTTLYAGFGDAFATQFNNYDGTGALYYTGTDTPNHSVFIVGWDDSVAHGGGTGAWIVKNSWGTNWGGTCGYGSTKGFFYIAYGSASVGKYSSVIKEYMDTDDRFSMLYHDEGGCTGAIGIGSPSLWGLTSLTATTESYLHRVEFWTNDTTTDVDVYVYNSFNGSSASGVLASSMNNAFAEPGYHYVELSEPLALTAGQTIHVAVKFGNQSYTYPLTVDGDGPTDAGKSFYSTNGSSWASLAANNVDTTIRARVSTSEEVSIMDPGGDPVPAPTWPVDLHLETAFPNPFNPTTTIEYSVHQPGLVELNIYDLQGALIRHLVTASQPAGVHQVTWDGRTDSGSLVPSGVYFCRAKAGHQSSSLKLVLLK